MTHSSTTIPLGDILRQYHLNLVVIAGWTSNMHEREVQWVHASELEDPTPFLPPRTVLLTTGARFSLLPDRSDADAYVRRLVEAGTTAIGFAVGLHWDRVPAHFVAACDAQRLPIFRVPYDTAFIEIVRTAAALIDAQVRERDMWALEAQRAIAQASMLQDGLNSTLHEASARLDRWIWVSDPAGRTVAQVSRPNSAAPPIGELQQEVRRLRDRAVSAIRIEPDKGHGVRMHALGRQCRMIGALAIEDRGAPDTAERTVMELVAALSTAQLEHRNTLDEAHSALRSAVVQLLLEGQDAIARTLTGDTLPRLPHAPFTVIRLPVEFAGQLLMQLPSITDGDDGTLHASYGGAPILILETNRRAAMVQALADLGFTAGVSLSGSQQELTSLLALADRALEHAERNDVRIPVEYDPAIHDGMLHLLDGLPGATARAGSLLAPLRAHDSRHDDVIERSLAVWLANHGQISAAATELGVHRHTLKGRVLTAADLLNLDLDSPDTRAELWAALRLTDATPR